MGETAEIGVSLVQEATMTPVDSPYLAVEETARKTTSVESSFRLLVFCLCGGIMTLAILWSYWPTLLQLISAWDHIPDYSHGYLVIPFSLFYLWVKRKECPGLERKLAWGGLLLLTVSLALRYLGTRFYLGSADAWSLVLWLGGMAWFLGGKAFFRWTLPALGFLFFMIPLPYGMERWMSLPLQRFATNCSCWTLQCLGQPAIAEENTIWLNNHSWEVEQACSGLRIFMGILALAYVYLVFTPRIWWERAFLLASVIPISLTANSARIVVTALLHQYVSSNAAIRFSHDFAGWVMIPFAAGLFGLALWYARRLVREEEDLDIRSIVGMKTKSQDHAG
jgi:exosortase